jgi:hypothetical protein
VRRIRIVILAALAAVLLLAFTAPSAKAVGIPGIDLCPKTAPFAALPNEGLIGVVGEQPQQISSFSTSTIWSNGGFAGMYTTPYDLGCAANPASYLKLGSAKANAATTNAILGVGYMATSVTDSIDRRAWAPQWIGAFLGDFTSRATDVISTKIIYPLLGLGLIVSSCYMLIRFRGGNVAGASSAVGWVFIVLALTAFVIISPVFISSSTQRAGDIAVSTLNGGDNASDSTTDRIVEAVHYQGWLRRTFGTADSPVAKKYGPSLLASERISWAELASNNDPDEIKALRTEKAKQFKEIAANVKDEDPGAYRWLTGEADGSGIALTETLYALTASFFRFAVDLLLVMATILIAILCLVWLAGSPYFVTPFGRITAVGVLNSTVRSVVYVLEAAVGSWLFGIYMQVSMQPGQSTWWSILLLFVGTLTAWTLIRPDRKMLALATMGHVRGHGRIVRLLTTMAMAYLGGRTAGRAAARQFQEEEVDITPGRSEDYVAAPLGQPVHVRVRPVMADERGIDSPAAPAGVVEGEVIWDSADMPTLPSGDVYQRPLAPDGPMPTPPPAGSLGEVEVYQRPTPVHEDDQYVTCPWCHGNGCGHCEYDGVIPKWVRDQVSPE